MNKLLGKVRFDADDAVVCHCNGVTRRALKEAAARLGPDLSAISRETGAGGVCGGCTAQISRLIGHGAMAPARLLEKEALDENHCRVRLSRVSQDTAPLVGADIVLQPQIGQTAHPRSYTATRLTDQAVELIVRREANGLVSRWLYDEATPAHEFAMTAPMGGIAFGGEDRPVFLACGIGITPALAVAFAAPTRPGRVYWWVRS
ncbi:MAG: (2Fe-2S)-binding protein, partial [Pseudomonadota bacterium]